MTTVYLNGRFLPRDQACVPVMDRGFLFGDGVYEVIPVYSRRPFRLASHLRRLQGSLDGIRLANPHGDAEWTQLIERIVPFFEEHPLRSKKRVDFEKFRDVLRMMETDEHLTEAGIGRIRRIAEQMNRGSQDRVQPARKLVGND